MARYKIDQKEQTRERIVAAAGRCFRKGGYSGVGVDGLAKEAGVTSGAFYGHFPSKEEAFKEAVVYGFKELREGIEQLKKEHGASWVENFIDFYLGYKRTCNLTEACVLQALTSEVVRSNDALRTIYQAEMTKVIEAVANGLPHGTSAEKHHSAWALLSILSGGVTIARALTDSESATQATAGIRNAALAIVGNPQKMA